MLLGKERGIQDAIPPNEYYEYFGPDYRLNVSWVGVFDQIVLGAGCHPD